ncbi:hypothetical protein GOP47_0026461 [Adiantum capillus-veneris]|nr:hypothetical protein GOP47_0026461 [Adiantum capillus-veneris]
MSLPGVESARRRRVSHGRSTLGYVQPPPLRRRSIPHPSSAAFFNTTAPRCLETGDQILDERAIAARHRLDARLREPATCRSSHTISRVHTSPPLPPPLQPQTRLTLQMLELKLGGRVEAGGVHHDDCPVCLDSFVGGQTIFNLPCQHTFHSKCIVPWLQNHSDCPSCRAQITLK